MKKYLIDYGFGKATLYTPYPYPEVRFSILGDTCFGLRKSIMCAVVIREEEVVETSEEWTERLEFNGDVYIWRKDGARKMIEPDWAADEEWDMSNAESVRYVENLEDYS